MDKSIKQALIVGIILLSLIIVFFIIHNKSKCNPSCSGAFYGIDDGCGGVCNCSDGGIRKDGGVCCYPNCDGNFCGDDRCGGVCKCDRLPGGTCKTVMDHENNPIKKCCYAQECNGVYCGNDGCGGECKCQSGATCSDTNGGVCANTGTSGWTYAVGFNNGMEQKDTDTPLECAQWIPANVKLNLSNFPCKNNDQCPHGDDCIDGFCNRNDMYQYWVHDPKAESGKSCTKYRQGTIVCGVKKDGASAFDIKNNKGPDKETCAVCDIKQLCPKEGKGACCPQRWTLKEGTSMCVDDSGTSKCCLNSSPKIDGYNACLATGLQSCETLQDTWWLADLGEVDSQCSSGVKGPGISLTKDTMNSNHFIDPCKNKYGGSSCKYDDGSTTFDGVCQNCHDNTNRCFPERMCIATYIAAGQQGRCKTSGMC